MGDKTRVRRGSWRAVVLAAVVVGGLAFAGGYWLAPEPVPQWAEAVSLAGSLIEVTEREHTGVRSTSATVELGPEQTLLAPMGGVVRATNCEPGAVIGSGQAVFTADDRTVIALHTQTPLFRDLALGMRGDDVTDLQTELARLGHDVPTDGIFRASTQRAVRDLWRSVGGPQRQLDLPLTQVMWLASEQATVAVCHLVIGERIKPDDPVLVAGGALESMTVRLAGLPAEDLVVTMVGLDATTPLPQDGHVTDRAFLDAVPALQAFSQMRTEGATELPVTAQLATPKQLVAVPPSALFNLSGGEGCIVADGQPMAVSVVASELGQALVSTPSPVRTVVVQPEDQAPCR